MDKWTNIHSILVRMDTYQVKNYVEMMADFDRNMARSIMHTYLKLEEFLQISDYNDGVFYG